MTVEITGDGVIKRNGVTSWTIGEGAFYENPTTIANDYTLSTNFNAMTAGPVTINDGVTVTVPDGSEWTIV